MGNRVWWTALAVLCGCSGADGSFPTGPSAKPDAVTIDAGRAAPSAKDAQAAAPVVEPYDAGYCEPFTCDSPALAGRTGSQDDGCGGFIFCAIKPAPSASATSTMDAGVIPSELDASLSTDVVYADGPDAAGRCFSFTSGGVCIPYLMTGQPCDGPHTTFQSEWPAPQCASGTCLNGYCR